ncbi:VOC family protein [Bacillus tianshenii]|nr:VOC family protein [Bacillus tianshenii]
MEIIRGIFETHLQVSSLERAKQFYGDTLGLKLGRIEADRRVVFYLIQGDEQSMLGLWESDYIQNRHFAFRVCGKHIQNMVPELLERKIKIVSKFGCPEEEPVVFPWLACASVYFEDPDGNLLELIAKLPEPPITSMRETAIPLSEWKRIHI